MRLLRILLGLSFLTFAIPVSVPADPLVGPMVLTGDTAGALFGFRIAVAGDVNGDGYSDLLVGSPSYSNGEVHEGRVQLFHGGPNGIDHVPSWSAELNRPQARFGLALAGAGDLNGDGYHDVVIGAPGFFGGSADEGRVYVYLGSAGGLSSSIHAVLEGGWDSARFGESVASAGDINSDGYDDIVVGAPETGGGLVFPGQGAIHVYHGSSSGLSMVNDTFILGTYQEAAHFGYAVSSVGDVNGDGYSDIAVGSPDYDAIQIFGDQGRVQLFLGSSSGIVTTAVWTEDGSSTGGHFGYSLDQAGDTNGDGYADLIIGASEWHDGVQAVGQATLYLGEVTGLQSAPAWFSNGSSEERYGQAVAAAGDVNGDGFADLVVGAPFYAESGSDRGRAQLFLGGPGAPDMSADWTYNFPHDNSVFGFAVACAGDLNGDGLGDLVIGIPQYDAGAGQDDTGRIHIMYGSGSFVDSNSAWSGSGDESLAFFGWPTGPAGDVNGDGFDDLLIGSYGSDLGGTDAGLVEVFHGSATGPSPAGSPDWSVMGAAGDGFGHAAAGVGDVDGDGYDDIAVGSPYHDGGEQDEGKISWFKGSPGGLGATAAWEWELDLSTAYLYRLAGAGDVNGDGFADLVISAPGWDGDFNDQGKAWLHRGSDSGPEEIPSWSFEGPDLVAVLGNIASAGDVNGDGFDDLLVGVGNYTNTFVGEGVAYLFFGSSTGLSVVPDWMVYGGELGAQMKDVASAGDVNGDGYADIMVGARYGTSPLGGQGFVRIYYGSASGPATTPDQILGLNAAGAQFGRTLSGRGDVDGDGYGDVLVGAPSFVGRAGEAGAAFLFKGSATGLDPDPVWTTSSVQLHALLGVGLGIVGDLDGDGLDEIAIGALYHDDSDADVGRVDVYRGGGRGFFSTLPAGGHPRQLQANGLPLSHMGISNVPDAMQLEVRAGSQAGRTMVRMEYQIEPLAPGPLSSIASFTDWLDTGLPDPTLGSTVVVNQPVTGLEQDRPHRWRMRICSRSPYFPHSRWSGESSSLPTLASFRTGNPASTVRDAMPSPGTMIQSIHPNPFNPRVSIAFMVDRPGQIKVDVFDVRGRTVKHLVDKWHEPGRYSINWDGRDQHGRSAASGEYLLRIKGPEGTDHGRALLLR